jgi:hypothetical protein
MRAKYINGWIQQQFEGVPVLICSHRDPSRENRKTLGHDTSQKSQFI